MAEEEEISLLEGNEVLEAEVVEDENIELIEEQSELKYPEIIEPEEFKDEVSLKSIAESVHEKTLLPTEKAIFEPQFPPLFKDDKSIFPTYSKLVDQRHKAIIGMIKDKTKRYRKVFKKDLEEQYMMSKTALDGVRIARCFVVGVRIPKTFSDPLNSRQRARVEYILKYNIT